MYLVLLNIINVILSFIRMFVLWRTRPRRKLLFKALLSMVYIHSACLSSQQPYTLKNHLCHLFWNIDVVPFFAFNMFSNKCNSSFIALSHCMSNKNLNVWHKTLHHPSLNIVKTVLNKCNLSFKISFKPCTSYSLGTSHALPIGTSLTKYTTSLQLVEANVHGLAPLLSSKGFRYYISVIDAFSKYTWVYLRKVKVKSSTCF